MILSAFHKKLQDPASIHHFSGRQENKGKIEIEIERRSDSEDSIDKPKQSGSNSPSSSRSKPRYADPQDYLPARRGSRDTHDTWDDPIYHGGSYNRDWRDSFSNRFPRRSYSSNDYIEPDDLPHGVSTIREGSLICPHNLWLTSA